MKKLTPIAQLQESILFLETKLVNEETLLKAEFKHTYESLKPISLIKNTLDELVNLPDFKETFIDTTLSLAAGYLSKKIVFGSTNNPSKQILGNLIQVAVTGFVSKNADDIRSFTTRIMANILTKSDKPA